MRRTATAARSWNSLPDSPPELLRGVAEIISHQQSTGSVFRDFEDLCQRLRERTMDNLRAARNGVSSKGVRRKRTKDRRRSGREELPWTVGMDDDTSSDGRQEPFVYGPDESAAYVGFRMPSAVALTTRLLEGLAEHDASFAPTSVIDFGAGPASTLWAIDEVWPGAMQRAVCIEPSQSMATAGRMLARGLRSSAAVEWIPSINHLFGQRGSRAAAQAQLVVAANVLGELPSDAGRSAAVELLWRTVAPNGALLISEPGSPWGSQVVRAARQGLLDAHGSSSSPRSDLGDGTQPDIIAPCPHSERCPMDAGDEARREAARRFIDPLDLDEAAEERLLAAEAAADAAAEAAGVVAGNSSGFVQVNASRIPRTFRVCESFSQFDSLFPLTLITLSSFFSFFSGATSHTARRRTRCTRNTSVRAVVRAVRSSPSFPMFSSERATRRSARRASTRSTKRAPA